MAFPMSLPSLPFGLGYGRSEAAGLSAKIGPPWPWEDISIGLVEWTSIRPPCEPVHRPARLVWRQPPGVFAPSEDRTALQLRGDRLSSAEPISLFVVVALTVRTVC